MKHIAFVLACGVVLGLASCTGGGGSSPSGAVKAFMEASKSGNKEAAMKCVQAKDREFFQKMEAQQKTNTPMMVPKDFTYKINEEKVTGETATVKVTGVQNGKEQVQELKLVKEDGSWKLDLIPDGMQNILEGMKGAAGTDAMKAMSEQMKKAMEDAAKEAEGEK